MNIFNSDAKLSSFSVGETGSNVTTVTFGHHSGKLLATGSEDSTIHIYLINQMTSLLSSKCQTNAITALKFSNEENMLASGCRSGAVKICDLESQKVIYPGGHKTCIRSMEYFPSSNNFLATGAVDGSAKLWDLRRKGFIFNYKGHNGAINVLKFSPDGRYLITASDDTAIRMWDITAGKAIKTFEEHQGPVFSIEYHPKELLFASAGADRRIKFWDLEKMKFICETNIETSAIKCLLFEPVDGRYILSGSNDTLCVHSWEPIQLVDTIQMNWKNILDMTIHKNQLFGASPSQNQVFIGSINLSNLKTKRRISPVRDYYPSEPKPHSIASNTIKRNEYQPINIKDKHAKNQPEILNIDELEISTTDNIMINNQADYDRIFQAKNRQEISTIGTISLQTSSHDQLPGIISTKQKTSQSISSSSQIDELEQSRTNEEIFVSLSKSHQTINSIQQKRIRSLILLINLSRTNSPRMNFQAIIASHDLSLECFFLRFVIEKLSKNDWNLDLCTLILPAIRDLIKSHYHWYNLIACQALEKVLSNFGRIIYDNIGAKSIDVDISQQARREKCQSCHLILHEIRCLIEDQLKNLVDSSLKQIFADNLRLLNVIEYS